MTLQVAIFPSAPGVLPQLLHRATSMVLLDLPFHCLPSCRCLAATLSTETSDSGTAGCLLRPILLQIVSESLVFGGGTWLHTDF